MGVYDTHTGVGEGVLRLTGIVPLAGMVSCHRSCRRSANQEVTRNLAVIDEIPFGGSFLLPFGGTDGGGSAYHLAGASTRAA